MGAAIGRIALGVAAATIALVPAGIATAQDSGPNSGSVNDYRLPEPTRTNTPPVIQGPVDPDNPISAPSSATRPERAPTPTPAPSITLPAPEPALRAPRPTAEPRTRPTAQSSPTSSSPAPEPPGEATPATSPPSPSFSSLPTMASDDATTEGPVPAPQASASEGESARWIAGAVAVILFGGAAAIFLRRRKPRGDEDVQVQTVAQPTDPTPEPQPAPTPRPQAEPRPAPTAAPSRTPAPVATGATATEALNLDIAFTPQAIRLSLVYATLQYQLAVTNTGEDPMPALQVRGDLASAHASLSTHDQLAPAPAQLEAQGSLAELAPGESALVTGEVRVPLNQVRPLVKGNAGFLVPLARFCLLAADGRAVRRVFTLGPLDANGTGAITPVRLDAGPRNLRELTAREVEAARAFTLDPVVAGS